MPYNHMKNLLIVHIHPYIILIGGITLIPQNKTSLYQTKEDSNLACAINNLSLLTKYIILFNNLCFNLLHPNKENRF